MKLRRSAHAPCPCGSGKKYRQCCQPYHKGLNVPNAEVLLRTRYSAYVLGLSAYIIDTTYPKGKAYEEDRSRWMASIKLFCKETRFLGWRLDETQGGEERSELVYWVGLRQRGRDLSFVERGNFYFDGEQWFYEGGEMVEDLKEDQSS